MLRRLAPVVCLLAACSRPDSEAITRWKGTPEGAEKLTAAVKDKGVAAGVRGEAAGALVEVGYGDRMEAAVAGLDVDDRAALIPAVVPRLVPLLDAPDPEKSGDARAALFSLREQATTSDARKAIEEVLYPALIKDVRAGRAQVGRSSLRDVLVGVGAPVLPLLLPLLEDPAVPFATPVAVIEKIGKTDDKEKAGDGLVARAKKATEALPEELWNAIATMGGKQAADFLIAGVERNTPPDVDRAAAALAKLPPRSAGVSSFAVSKAGNLVTPAPLREQLFLVAERDQGDESKKALLALIASTLDNAIRHRAFRALLKAGGGRALLEGLEAYPTRTRLSATELREEIVKPITTMPGMDTRGPLYKAFDSKSPLARLVAILAIEYQGFKSDADKIGKLARDTGAVPGLPPEDRIDRQANRAVAALKKSAY